MKGQSDKSRILEKYFFPILVQEHTYWMNTHSKNVELNGKIFLLNQYRANTESPRPESYR